jgi:peptidoglycan/LPS O-acetylase OafA/YrhL
MSSHKNYIPHIDGIRAISVLAVIFFHFHLLNFTGGFIGVDVFFTISGYLIIGSIVGQADAGKFKASNFWGRRIRRLFPAIFAVLFLSFFAGMLLMSPGDLTKLSRDSLFGLVSLINFTLLGETDYFDLEGFNEPFLHFWSLAVEEQFYLVFPLIALLILALFRKPVMYKKAVVWCLLILSLISLGVAEWAIRSGHALFVYYMMPTRFFQMALGGVLAIWLQSDSFRQSRDSLRRGFHDLLVVAGIATIIVLSLAFTKYTPFPGVNAVWPTLAALALLNSGGLSRLSSLLENPISAHLGKLSYSLYLVHWPVWTFMCYYFDRTLTLPETGIALLATYLISLFIYKCVETPVRFSPAFAGKRLYAAVVPASVAAAGLFFLTIAMQGWPQRLQEDQRSFVKNAADYHRVNFGGAGYAKQEFIKLGHPLAEPEFLLYGDSKAGQLLYGLDQALLEKNRGALAYVQDGCAFLPGVGKLDRGKRIYSCNKSSTKAKDYAKSKGLPVLMARSWMFDKPGLYEYQSDGSNRLLAEHEIAQRHINVITEVSNAIFPSEVVVLASNNIFNRQRTGGSAISGCISRPKFLGLPCLARSSVLVKDLQTNNIEIKLRSLAEKKSNIKFLDRDELYCETEICRQIAPNGLILYSDSTHLSINGSVGVAKTLLTLTGFAQISAPNPGKIIEFDSVISSLKTAWNSNDMQVFQQGLEDLVKFSSHSSDYYNLVNALWDGLGTTEKNRPLALAIGEFISKNSDESLSTYISGFAYWWGAAGVEKDFDKTLEYWEKPSQLTNATVQYRMAEIYLDESLPQHDPIQGMEKLRFAAKAGNEDAIAHLATLND